MIKNKICGNNFTSNILKRAVRLAFVTCQSNDLWNVKTSDRQ